MKVAILYLNLTMLTLSLAAQQLHTRSNDLHIDLNQAQTRTTVPIITWISPKHDYTQSANFVVAIDAEVRSNVALQSLEIRVGDQRTGGLRGEKKIGIPAETFDYHLTSNITLGDELNFIEIIARCGNGTKVSTKRIVRSGQDVSDFVAVDRKDYALLFATDKYDNWPNLTNPVSDAKALGQHLKEKFNFETRIIENAEQSEIIETIREYSQREFKRHDQLFIFFAGHGQFDDVLGEGYVVAKNSIENDKSKTSYLSHSNLRTYINNIRCEHILLAMDVCFGGTFDPLIARNRATEDLWEGTESAFLARKLSKKTRLYVTSGGKEYVSDGSPGKHSPFATRFLEAFASNGGDDRIMTLAELNSFLEKTEHHEPRFGEFGDNEKGSDFLFVVR
jgi:hypothetical protein